MKIDAEVLAYELRTGADALASIVPDQITNNESVKSELLSAHAMMTTVLVAHGLLPVTFKPRRVA